MAMPLGILTIKMILHGKGLRLDFGGMLKIMAVEQLRFTMFCVHTVPI